MKYCKECFQTKPFTDFYKHQGRKDGYDDICKPCKQKKLKQRPTNLISYLKRISKKENIYLLDLKKIWDKQQGLCALSAFPLTFSNQFNIYNAQLIRLPMPVLVCYKTKQMLEYLNLENLYLFCNAILTNKE